MPSVIPLDHRPSRFSKLFSSHLRAYYVDACVPHAIIMDAHAHRTIIRFSFALLNDVLIFSISKYLSSKRLIVDRESNPGPSITCRVSYPLDHRPSRFSKLFSSHLRAYYVDTCIPHAIIMDAHAHRTIIRFSFALLNDVLIFLYKQIFELEKVDRRPGIKPGSLNYMPSVIPLDHRPSRFSKLFSSHLRAYYVDACIPHAIIMDAHAHRTIIRFSFALL